MTFVSRTNAGGLQRDLERRRAGGAGQAIGGSAIGSKRRLECGYLGRNVD